MELPVLRAEEVPGEGHAGGAEDSVVQVVPTVVPGCLHVCDEARRRRRQHLRALIVEPGLDQPEDDVATAQAARCPGCAAAREDDRPARLVQLLRDLAAGLAAPDHEHLARRQRGLVRVAGGVELDDAVRRRAGRSMGPLVRTRADDDRPRPERTVGGLQREADAVRRLERRDGDAFTDRSAERAGPPLEMTDDLVLGQEPFRVVAGVCAAR